MGRIKNFDIVINKCLWEIKPTSETLDLDKNDFLLSVINGFEEGKWRKNRRRGKGRNNCTSILKVHSYCRRKR